MPCGACSTNPYPWAQHVGAFAGTLRSMTATKALTLRLEAEEFERLQAEAQRRQVSARALAEAYVRGGLEGQLTAERRRVGLAALDRLDGLAQSLPPIDAVRIASEVREELRQRPSP